MGGYSMKDKINKWILETLVIIFIINYSLLVYHNLKMIKILKEYYNYLKNKHLKMVNNILFKKKIGNWI